MLTTEGSSFSARSAKLSGAGRAAAGWTSVAGVAIRKAATTPAATRRTRLDGMKGTEVNSQKQQQTIGFFKRHRGSVAGYLRDRGEALRIPAYSTANIIVAPARQGQLRHRRPPAPLAATFAAELQGRAPRPASYLREKGRREHPRSPGRERAPSTNPSLPARRRAETRPGTDRRAAIRGTAHREPAVAPGGVGLAAVPSKFSKKRKKPLSGVSTKEVLRPLSASR